MRKSVYLLFCFCFASLSAFASWGRFTIKFNDNHADDTISRSCYNLIVSKGTVNDEGIAKIYISIKNNDPTYSIYLFDKTYSKKELRKYYRIVVNNKECEQVLETNYCKFISNVHCVPPFQLNPLEQLQIHEGEEMEIVIPVFLAKKKNSISNKIQIFTETVSKRSKKTTRITSTSVMSATSFSKTLPSNSFAVTPSTNPPWNNKKSRIKPPSRTYASKSRANS